MDPIFVFGVIVCVGFFFAGLATRLNLPKVTGYILAGIILNPNLFHFVPAEFAKQTAPITDIALAFITFSVGGTLWFKHIKSLGRSILSITFFEAEFAFLTVGLCSAFVVPFFVHVPNASWMTVYIPMSLLLACLAAPTDPSATLAVIHQYKAKGPVSSTIMGVAAMDDVLGIINYSLAMVVAPALIMQISFSVGSFAANTLFVIGGAILVGVITGIFFNLVSALVRKKHTEGVLIILVVGLLSVCFGFAKVIKVDALLASMVMGIVVVNFNKNRDQIFQILERYTEQLVFVLFFTLSGMHLNLQVFIHSLGLILLFFVFRTLGKYLGTLTGAVISKAPEAVRKYTVGGLIPQGGIVVGLALTMKDHPAFGDIADLLISIIIGSTVIHEFIGPIMATIALKKAGETTASA